MEKTSTDILNEAADLLEEEGRWGKGIFFRKAKDSSGPACVMCTHGAIAYCGNPEVRESVTKYGGTNAGLEAGAMYVASSLIEFVSHSPKQYFQKYYPSNPETALAHYRAAQAGLTISFNDAPERTQQEVVAKLREAAQNPIE